MTDAPQGRRARLRAEATAEIKAIALAHMATGDPSSISLRAIAREMGMTAGAIYSYFASRDDLMSALTIDLYDALADRLEVAQATAPDSAADKVLAHARAYRTWGIDHPDEFRLIYGNPEPGYVPPEDGAALHAEHRVCLTLLDLVAAAWPQAAASRERDDYSWSDFQPGLVALTQQNFPDLPPAAVALCLTMWTRMHGLLALEVYGHLRHQVLDLEKLYQADIRDMIHSLGLVIA